MTGQERSPGESDSAPLPVLVVDDEAPILRLYERMLRSAGIDEVLCCQDSRDVEAIFSEREIGAVILDLSMPHITGEELLPILAGHNPEVPIIVVTGANQVETVVNCMKAGAFDYMVKPVDLQRLKIAIRRALELRELRRENTMLKEKVLAGELAHPEAFAAIVTNDQAMRSLFQYLEAIAGSPQPVFITGETGVGKELVANAVHEVSGRAGHFVAVNVAGLDDTLFSDTLFGHVRGAYTDAGEDRGGLVEQAEGGTLFLDEIGDLSPLSQAKLLRLLQEGEYSTLGEDAVRHSDARIIVATNRDLDRADSDNAFRRDLYYRLKTHHIKIPPLRERMGDVPLLLDHLLDKAARTLGKSKPTPPPELVELLSTHDFPGNVRELESMVFDAVSKHRSRMLSMDVFKDRIMRLPSAGRTAGKSFLQPIESPERFPTLKQTTEFLVAEAMRLARGKQSIAAQLLGMSRPSLNRRLKRAQDAGGDDADRV